MCNDLKTVFHKSAETACSQQASSYKGKYIRRHWWSDSCLIARDRQRFWHRLWDSCGRPREGHVHDSYKLAKKTYRNVCRSALNSTAQQSIMKLNMLHGDRKIKQFWNYVNRNKSSNGSCTDDISINVLINHFREKFRNNLNAESSFIKQASLEVEKHYDKLKNKIYHDFRLTEKMLLKYINKLNMGCAAGIDGITAEHMKYATGTKVIETLCNMLTICIQFGIVPVSFAEGLLVPMLKKPNVDPSVPKTIDQL